MAFFSKKKIYELDDVSTMTSAEREDAIIALEMRRCEINSELEGIMRSYSRLTKKRGLVKRKYKPGYSPNDYKPIKNK